MTTINTDIHDALMAGVNTAVTGMPIVWENIEKSPALTTPFCKVDMLPHSVEPATLGLDGLNEHRGTVLLVFNYPIDSGVIDGLGKMDEVSSVLKRGVTLTSGTALVRIESVWRAPVAYDKSWARFPLQLRWRCHAES